MGGARLVFVVLVALAPCAAAAADSFRVESAAPVALDGDLRAIGAGGILLVHGPVSGVLVVEGATGEVVVSEGRDLVTGDVRQPLEDATRSRFEVDGALVTVVLVDETLVAVATTGTSGRVVVEDRVTGAGTPTWTTTAGARSDDVVPATMEGPETVDARWESGWARVGTGTVTGTGRTYPAAAAPTLRLEGELRLMVIGGNASFMDAEGQDRAFRLGEWTEGSTILGEVRAWRTLVLDVIVSSASVPAAPTWEGAAPTFAWSFDGTAAWTEASGEVVRDGASTTFEDRDVSMEVGGEIVPERGAVVPPVAPIRYEGEGDVRALALDGTPAASSRSGPSTAATAAGATAGAVALAWFLARSPALLAALYTRLDPSKLLDNPTRKAIYEAVRASPGLHLREIQRRIGGAWGLVEFHVRFLKEAGFVKFVQDGRYTLVYPTAAHATGAEAAVVVPHPVARAVYDAVPAQGVVAFAELQQRTGLSRQLLTYHLRGLEKRGLVAAVPTADARRGVARVAAHA